MKKISILAALTAVLTLSFTSCKEDTQPRLEYPEAGSFVLNTPAFANQLYLVEEGGSIEFTCSQANYGGLATTPQYQLEVSSNPEFTEVKNAEGEVVSPALVDFTTTSAKMVVPAESFAMAVCGIYQYEGEDQCEASVNPVYVRCVSRILNASDKYTITSNVVTLKQVKVYYAVPVPEAIYLVGQPEGWKAEPKKEWMLPETEDGSRVYKATFYIPENQFQFRFYDDFKEGDEWNWFSIGAQDDDNPVDITLTDGEYTGNCFYDPSDDTGEGKGKGAWQVPNFPGGNVEMTVNLNSLTVVFKLVD